MEKALALSLFFPCVPLVDSWTRFLQTLNSKFQNSRCQLARRHNNAGTRNNKKNAFVVEKYVGQLGEKSHRIIARIDGTVIFGRECSRERVWGRCFSFLGTIIPEEERDVQMCREEKQRTHFLAVAILNFYAGVPALLLSSYRARGKKKRER